MIKTKSILFAGFVISLGIAIIAGSSKFKTVTVPYDLGPTIYPMVLGVLLIILGTIMLIQELVKKEEAEGVSPIPLIVIIFAVVTVLYLILVDILGFLITSIPVVSFLSYIMGQKSIGKTVLFGITVCVSAFLVFELGLNVPLPDGIVGF